MKQYLDKDKSEKTLPSNIGYIESGMSYYRYLF